MLFLEERDMDGEQLWQQARQHARGFLRRFGDAWTRNHREDLIQQAAVAAWRWGDRVRDPGAFWAAVRTISRRMRGRALDDAARERDARRTLLHVREGAQGDGERHYRIAGRWVPADCVHPHLQRALARLRPLDRQLLLGFHEGFCCAELSARCDRSEQCVKTRIHRARRRVQMEVEENVRAAGGLDE
jgi:DNA-directed RNA polymerase specialized sigma24 family protein